jgi:pimeloyl-ACP methyl ester carboxylesterase
MSSGNGARCAWCTTRLAGQDGTRFRSSSCRHCWPSPTSSTSPLGSALVDHLVERGLELFLLDFGIPDSRDRQLRFEDHLCVIDLAMRELLAQTGVKRATLLGYCLGGIFATLYAAIHRTNVGNLVTLATPVDFSRAGPVYRYVRTLDVDGLVDRLGNVPGEWIRDQVWALTTMTMPARNLRIWRELLSCSWDPSHRSASDWSAAGSTTSCRFQGRRTASSSRIWSRPTSSYAVNSWSMGTWPIPPRSPARSSSWPTPAMSLHPPSRPRPCSR